MASATKNWKIIEEPLEGAAVKLGGTVIIVPPVTLGWVKTNKDKIKNLLTLKDSSPADQMGLLPEIASMLHAAVRRNYPDVTMEDVEDVVDIRNFNKLLEAAMGQAEVTLPVPVNAAGELKPQAS
jgi:hypothetical protein